MISLRAPRLIQIERHHDGRTVPGPGDDDSAETLRTHHPIVTRGRRYCSAQDWVCASTVSLPGTPPRHSQPTGARSDLEDLVLGDIDIERPLTGRRVCRCSGRDLPDA